MKKGGRHGRTKTGDAVQKEGYDIKNLPTQGHDIMRIRVTVGIFRVSVLVIRHRLLFLLRLIS